MSEAVELMALSMRQVRRQRAAYREEGAGGVAHGNRGRQAQNALDAQTAERVVALARQRYRGVNQQHLTELLEEEQQIRLSRSTVRRVLLRAGIRSPQRRRAPKHRRRRERKPREGMLLQIDGSPHNAAADNEDKEDPAVAVPRQAHGLRVTEEGGGSHARLTGGGTTPEPGRPGT